MFSYDKVLRAIGKNPSLPELFHAVTHNKTAQTLFSPLVEPLYSNNQNIKTSLIGLTNETNFCIFKTF